MSRPYSSVEADNRTAFQVQLSALLTQVSMTINSTALSSASKARLSDIRTAVEEWVKEIGNVAAPKPTIATAAVEPVATAASGPPPSPPSTPPAPGAPPAESLEGAEEGEATGSEATPKEREEGESAGPSPPPAAAEPDSGSGKTQGSAPASPGPAPVSATAEDDGQAQRATDESACEYGTKNITDITSFMQLLFTSGIPESQRLRMMAKALARLVSVRCASVISAALQHVLHLTYGAGGSKSRPGSPAPSQPSSPLTPPAPEAVARLQASFVILARDIRLSSKALVGCLEVMSQNTDFADAASVRLPTQLCVDALKQARRTLSLFHHRVAKEELALAQAALLAGTQPDRSDDGPAEDEEAAGVELSARADAAVEARVAALKALWGPSLTFGLVVVGNVIRTAVAFLCAVAAVKELGATADLAALRIEAQNDLFALCDSLPPSTTTTAAAAATAAVPTDDSNAADGAGKGPSAAAPAAGSSNSVNLAGSSSGGGTNREEVSTARAIAATIPLCLGVSYQAEYLVAVAERSGDEDDGRLVATRILTDALRHVGRTDPAQLSLVIANEKWRKRLLGGLLNCLVSLQPAVLSAGLDGLRAIVTTCRGALGQEIGMLYSGCVFRLLESDNSPQLVKRHILLHLISTFLNSPGGSDGEGRATGQASTTQRRNTEAPLLLHLYRAYDLNEHAHQLNIVQQFIMALSRIVRQAPRSEFAMDAAAHKAFIQAQQQQQQQQQQQRDARGAAASSSPSTSLSPADLLMTQQSLPTIALHGLVLTVETMVRQAPREDDNGRDILALLPDIPNRARKLEEQRQVDLFNSAPRKAIQKMFNVQPEEMSPPGTEGYLITCEHETLPPPATAATQAKVDAVAEFLLSINSLSPESVAEYLSTPAVFPLQVCDAYMARLDLSGKGVVEAVKELLGTVQLPKEGQRIERMLEFFCAAYYRANDVPGTDRHTLFPFENEQACLLLVVSVVMLNTSLHNPKAGQQMTPNTFRRQLGKCNNEKDFAGFFLDDIFESISRQPLTEVKSVGAATLQGSSYNSTTSAAEQPRGFDALFISHEERRRLAFGIERQRVVSETRYLLDRRYRLRALSSREDWTWWCAAARDLFLSSWSHVCAVFGPAMYEGDSPPEEVLVKCIRGLQALMCMGASFALSTECEVTMLALLHMCEYTVVRDICISAVLTVASTSYAVHLSPRCWYAIFDLLIGLRRQNSPMLEQAENVLARVESFTRLSCEERQRAAEVGDDGENPPTAVAASPSAETPSVAVRRVLEGVMDLLKDVPPADAATTLSAGLYFLKRCLGYSVISHSSRGGTDVVHCVNVHDVAKVVVPRLVSMVRRHANKDETLQTLMNFVVDILGAVWSSHSIHLYTVEEPAMNGSAKANAAPRYVTVDTAPAEFVECYEFFKQCYDVQGGGGAVGSTLVKTHLLQIVKEVMTLTLGAVEVGQSCQLSLSTIIAAWRRILYPLARALSDRESAGTEVCGLAGLVLRKLVVLGCGTGSNAASLIPSRVRAALLSLLADLAYIGCMCSDVDSAQECLSRLVAICTTALTSQPGLAAGGEAVVATASQLGGAGAAAAHLLARNHSDKLVHRMVTGLHADTHYAATHAVERLTLLLRCNREQTRAEAVESLRTLSVQLQATQVRHLVLQLSEVVLEATVGHAAPHYQVPLSDPSLVSFWVFLLDVPPTMKRCSRTAFRATLPGALGFMVNELLSVLPPQHLADVANVVMARCLVPIIVSPSVSAFPSRSLAARCLTQCAMMCLSRGAQNTVGVDATRQQWRNSSSEGSPGEEREGDELMGGGGGTVGITPLTCVLRCTALVLQCIRVPESGLAPADADFVGRTWLRTTPGDSAPFDSQAARQSDLYTRSVARAMASLVQSSPQQIAGNTRYASLSPPLPIHPSNDNDNGDGSEDGREGTAHSDSLVDQFIRDNRDSDVPTRVVSDEELVEYCNFLVQILPGLPKVLNASSTSSLAGEREEALLLRAESEMAERGLARGAAPCDVEEGWAPPPVPATVLLRSLLGAARVLFAGLWRVMHPYEMNLFYQRVVGDGGAGGGGVAVMKTSAALLPHAAIRGVLNSFVELALRTPSYSASQLLSVTVDVLQGMSTLQTNTQQQQQQHQQQYHGSSAALGSSHEQQRLSPQEQQHMRTCTVGMYQELSVVLSHWVKLYIQPTPSAAASSPVVAAQRQEELRQLALSPQLFSALVNLLSPTAGSIIVTVRDYFAWFIVQKQLTVPPALANGGDGPLQKELFPVHSPGDSTSTTTAATAVQAQALHKPPPPLLPPAVAVTEEEESLL